VEQATYPFVQLGPGHDLVTARHLGQRQPRPRQVVAPQVVDRGGDIFLALVGEQLVERLRRQRIRRRKDERLDHRLQFRRREADNLLGRRNLLHQRRGILRSHAVAVGRRRLVSNCCGTG
jgi:hypothetical protein